MVRLLWIGVILSILLAAQVARADSLFKGDELTPADAIVLFDGKDLSGWVSAASDKPAGWKVEKGYMEVNGTGNIASKREFGSYQLHVEFRLPLMADAKGQARSNSGVYMHGRYEVQVLDSYGLNSQSDDCGGIYKVAVPLANACRPPEQWQSYDIVFHAPTFDKDGHKVTNAKLTVMQNGVLIQDNAEVPAPTGAGISSDDKAMGPLMLQDHGCKVRYRNIWLRPLK
jgi:hypothetical protein